MFCCRWNWESQISVNVKEECDTTWVCKKGTVEGLPCYFSLGNTLPLCQVQDITGYIISSMTEDIWSGALLGNFTANYGKLVIDWSEKWALEFQRNSDFAYLSKWGRVGNWSG